METLGTKVVVLGAGGTGCKILEQLAPAVPPNAELIALDTDKTRLSSLNEKIKRVEIGETISTCRNAEEIRGFLGPTLQSIEESLSGAELVILSLGLGGKVGSLLSSFIADVCSSKGIFTLVIATYPLMRISGPGGTKDIAESLRAHSSGVIIVDNNLNLEDDNSAITDVFSKINSVICELMMLIMSSISGAGYLPLTADELRHFFYGDFFFALTAGSGNTLSEAAGKALKDVGRYTGESGVGKMLVMAAGPGDISIDEMRALNERMQKEFNIDMVKWACAQRNKFETLVVFGVAEMPLLKGIELPVTSSGAESNLTNTAVSPVDVPLIGPEKPEASEAKVPDAPANAQEKKAPDSAYFNFNTLDNYKAQPRRLRSPALIGLKEGVQPRALAPEKKAGTEGIDIYSLGKRKYNDDMQSSGKESGIMHDYGGDLTGKKPGDEEEYAGESPKEEMDSVVNDIIGFPNLPPQKTYKKPETPQRKIGDYDELGIDYV